MKKRVMLVTLFLFLIFTISFAISQGETEEDKINEAYQCLTDKVETKCSSLSTEEKIFSLLAIDECEAEVIADSANDGECWPASNCRLTTTAQAVLALDNTNSDTTKAEDWLLSQNRTASGMEWFLEIESSEATTCTIDYSGLSHSVDIGDDKKISSNAGSCLTLAQDDFWLRISPSCYGEEFEISCDQTFLTTLLFKKSTSSVIQVSETASSAAAGGITQEKVDSLCFERNGACDYEGSLWSASTLDSLGRDISSHLPYLITFADENQRFIPESFLFLLTSKNDFRTSILAGQKSNKWWLESGDKYYDTAVALSPFKQENLQEKEDAKAWLLETQDAEGCWQGNVRNTAFLLSTIWPRDFSSGGGGGGGGDDDGLLDCEAEGYFCMSGASCEGEILSEYECPAFFRCCNTPQIDPTCSDINGEVCSSNQVCKGTTISAADVNNCCIQGSCEIILVDGGVSACELNSGSCRQYGCDSGEEEAFFSCDFSGDTCCILGDRDKGGGSLVWVWVLLFLIIFVVLGIIFRNKLKDFWFRMSSGRRPRPHGGPFRGPGPRLAHPPMHPRHVQRRILPPQRRAAPRPRRPKVSKELDDVLKKLKEMGK